VIGPLVIAGVSVKKKRIHELEAAGVKDSKMLTPGQRTRLTPIIRQIVERISITELAPEEIDEFVLRGRKLRKLNYLEARAMARVIEKLDPAIAYVDASDVRTERFAQHIQEQLSKRVRIVSEHHADEKYPVVSAASIIAKVTRDQRIEELERQYGEFGSGYPSDQRTVCFLEDWIKKHGSLPAFVRKSWKTIRRIEQETKQTRLESTSPQR
jgi:ribonuclease HII